MTSSVLSDRMVLSGPTASLTRQITLVVLGVVIMALAAKIKIPIWPSPVPITLGTLAVLTIGSAYGPRLGVLTVLAYLAVGALGFDVFSNSSADISGLTYMLGGTGGYLVGYLAAALVLGGFARAGWDRNIALMAVAMAAGTMVIYIPGLLWLRQFAADWTQTLAWGLWPFVVGDMLKLAVAALVFPAFWRVLGRSR